MDIEGSEWDSLPNIMDDGVLNKVKQLALEIHTYVGGWTPESFNWKMDLLKRLETLGFKKWYSHINPECTRPSIHQEKVYVSTCIEMSYINTNFIVVV